MVDWVETNLDKARPSAGRGTEWTATCPECGKFGGFYVNVDPDHERSGSFVCFKCELRGKNFAALIAKVEDIDFSDARRMIMKGAVEFRRRETAEVLSDRIRGLRHTEDLGEDAWGALVEGELPREYMPVWNGKVWRVPEYMTERRFFRETLRDWKVGFCERGSYYDRVIIPFECPNGRSFTARDLSGKDQEIDGSFRPKYRNPKGVDHGRLVYGWPFAPIAKDFALVEGPLDSMKFYQHGIPALGTGGKVLRSEQLAMLFKRPAHVRVTVMYDPEEAVAPYDAAEQLITRFRNLYIGKLPLKVDPGASKKKVALEAMREAKPFDGGRNARVFSIISATRERLSKRY